MIISAVMDYQYKLSSQAKAVDVESLEKTKTDCENQIKAVDHDRARAQDLDEIYHFVQDKVFGIDKVKCRNRSVKNEKDESFF